MAYYIISFSSIPRKYLEEVKYHVNELGESVSIRKLSIGNIDTALNDIKEGWTEWTIDRNSGISVGDTVFIVCSSTSNVYIRSLRKTVKKIVSSEELERLDDLCEKYDKYAGCMLFAGLVESIEDLPERIVYAKLSPVLGFDNPIPSSEFTSFIALNKYGSMTRITSDDYNHLIEIIKKRNEDLDLSVIDKRFPSKHSRTRKEINAAVKASFVCVNFPRSLDELASNIWVPEPVFYTNMDILGTSDLINVDEEEGTADFVCGTGTLTEYPVPKLAKAGDICFFVCQHSAMRVFERLARETYDLCDTNINFDEFCRWITEPRNLLIHQYKTKTRICELFLEDHNDYSPLQTNDVILVEHTIKEIKYKTYSCFNRKRNVFGFKKTNYQKALQYVLDGNYKYFRFKHKYAGIIISNIGQIFKSASEYSNKIFAAGIVSSHPQKCIEHSFKNWDHRFVSDYEKCFSLGTPVDVSELNVCINFSLNDGCASIPQSLFENIKIAISSKNETPDYLNSINLVSMIDDGSLISIASEYEQESQAEEMPLTQLRFVAESREVSKPRKMETSSTQYRRDPYIAELAKREANGICQLCGNPAPFFTPSGKPYLESHHIDWLSEGGSDTIENTVAVCPNCHRRLHVINDIDDVELLKSLKQGKPLTY